MVRSVVDYWSSKNSLKGIYSFEITLYNGYVVMRTKDSMSSENWLPVGGLRYARPLLSMPDARNPTLYYVVPGVLSVASMRSSIDGLRSRLSTQRSIIKYPAEKAGAAYSWCCTFLSDEEKRQERMCKSCRNIREELATIVVHQQKTKVPENRTINAVKLARREELLSDLTVHACVDRDSGLLTVSIDQSAVLKILIAGRNRRFQGHDQSESKLKDDSKLDAHELKNDLRQEGSDSDSCDERDCDHTCFMPRTLAKSSYPAALRDRPSRLRKGMLAIVPCSALPGEWMAGQPFWMVKILRLTAHHTTLHYLGPEFLGSYKLLCNEDGSNAVDTFKNEDLTILHWNVTLTHKTKGGGGKMSKGDQRVLGYDVRVPWTLPEHDPSELITSKRTRSPDASESNPIKKLKA